MLAGAPLLWEARRLGLLPLDRTPEAEAAAEVLERGNDGRRGWWLLADEVADEAEAFADRDFW